MLKQILIFILKIKQLLLKRFLKVKFLHSEIDIVGDTSNEVSVGVPSMQAVSACLPILFFHINQITNGHMA